MLANGPKQGGRTGMNKSAGVLKNGLKSGFIKVLKPSLLTTPASLGHPSVEPSTWTSHIPAVLWAQTIQHSPEQPITPAEVPKHSPVLQKECETHLKHLCSTPPCISSSGHILERRRGHF